MFYIVAVSERKRNDLKKLYETLNLNLWMDI